MVCTQLDCHWKTRHSDTCPRLTYKIIQIIHYANNDYIFNRILACKWWDNYLLSSHTTQWKITNVKSRTPARFGISCLRGCELPGTPRKRRLVELCYLQACVVEHHVRPTFKAGMYFVLNVCWHWLQSRQSDCDSSESGATTRSSARAGEVWSV